MLCLKNVKLLYTTERNLSIDESLHLWKCCPSWMQYISLKAAQSRIKLYDMCKSRSGYLWNFFFKTAKDTQYNTIAVKKQLKTVVCAISLVQPLQEKGMRSGWTIIITVQNLPVFLKIKIQTALALNELVGKMFQNHLVK